MVYEEVIINESDTSILTFTGTDDRQLMVAINDFFKEKKKSPVQLHEKLINTFKDFYKIDPSNIIAYGETNVSNQFATKYIERIEIPNINARKFDEPIYACKCFVDNSQIEIGDQLVDRWKTNVDNVILHEDALSSWKCLMSHTHNPKFGFIRKIEK